ncbi:MAG TPA: GDP-mannose 4,6-dehydratase [Bacteroidales bacterium]|nr:GDP-mannose 4,6-dehydratase [Bacteroidales bacterium]HRZ77551.1 GDP-mannose 4,6-dehydratase [Bacteroidales bacterium]
MSRGKILLTGGAGFIGSHLSARLLAEGWELEVVDSFDPYYDPVIKERNVSGFLGSPAYRLHRTDIRDAEALQGLDGPYQAIVHLAARAGVRPSLADPVTYQEVNVRGTQNLLEMARRCGIPRFIFASSSSVYGLNNALPWHEEDAVLRPISPYASTKVSGELLGHVYSHLYGIRFLALRFFTVYGPGQRPDLAIHKFSRLMLQGLPVPFYGDGSSRRDYTYIDDIVQGICGALAYEGSRYEVVNLGNDRTVSLSQMVAQLEEALGLKALIDPQPDAPGDLPATWASIRKAADLFGYAPATRFEEGVGQFAHWIRQQPL